MSAYADRAMSVATGEAERVAELRASAKGWHGIQLAALGFIGLCGVIKTGDGSDPWTLQVLSGILVLVAFALACAGIVFVGRAAWPLYGGGAGSAGSAADVSRQLTRGLVLTFLSVAALSLGTATSWWPQEGGGDGSGAAEVQVQTSDGRSACGTLQEPRQAGALRLAADSQVLDLDLGSIATIAPVGGC